MGNLKIINDKCKEKQDGGQPTPYLISDLFDRYDSISS